MTEAPRHNENEPQRTFTVRSPYNQLALFEAVWMHTANEGEELDRITANPQIHRTHYEVSKKLVGGYIGLHETDPLLKPPNMYQWSILGMPAEDALVVPGHAANDRVHQYQERVAEVAFTNPEEIAFLYGAADEYLAEKTQKIRDGRVVPEHYVQIAVIPLRTIMQELAMANGIETTPALLARWGIDGISEEIELFLRSLNEEE